MIAVLLGTPAHHAWPPALCGCHAPPEPLITPFPGVLWEEEQQNNMSKGNMHCVALVW